MEQKIYLASNHSNLDVGFWANVGDGELKCLWNFSPEKVSLSELDSCIICELFCPPGMEDALQGFLSFLCERNLISKSIAIYVALDKSNKKELMGRIFDVTAPNVLLCVLRKPSGNIFESNDATCKYSKDEEEFFSQFTKEDPINEEC